MNILNSILSWTNIVQLLTAWQSCVWKSWETSGFVGNDLDVPTLANMLKFGGLTLRLFVWLRTAFEDVNITGQGLQTIVCSSACWEAHNTLRDWREDLYTSNTACERHGAWKVLLRGAIIVFYDDGYFSQINSQTGKCLQKTIHPSRLFLGSWAKDVTVFREFWERRASTHPHPKCNVWRLTFFFCRKDMAIPLVATLSFFTKSMAQTRIILFFRQRYLDFIQAVSYFAESATCWTSSSIPDHKHLLNKLSTSFFFRLASHWALSEVLTFHNWTRHDENCSMQDSLYTTVAVNPHSPPFFLLLKDTLEKYGNVSIFISRLQCMFPLL